MTSPNPDWSVRVNFDIDGPTHTRFSRMLPHGTKSELMRALIRTLLRDVEERGIGAIEPLLDDSATIRRRKND